MNKNSDTVCEMFNAISPTYDRVNRIVSFGIDRIWRNRLARELPSKKELHLLDIATGTADQLIALLAHCPNISRALGIDVAKEMLDLGNKKLFRRGFSTRASLLQASALALPAASESMDCTTISFGVRNVGDFFASLREMYRVLRPGGQALILEFSLPRNRMIRAAHLFYLRQLLPRIGGLISGNRKAYDYLNQTIEKFPYGEAFCERMGEAGFCDVEAIPMTFGVATLYKGKKPCTCSNG